MTFSLWRSCLLTKIASDCGLKPTVLLHQPPECWNYRFLLPCLAMPVGPLIEHLELGSRETLICY